MPIAMSERSAFWDASGITLLCLAQPDANQARRLERSHSRLVVWWGTTVEATSAFERVRRAGAAPPVECDRALARLEALSHRWIEVQPVDRVRSLAMDLLARYPLRAADALQLGAALMWTKERARNRIFVTFDERLGRAAAAHGFSVQPPLT
jgi:predicted nucleic acid-binding protein